MPLHHALAIGTLVAISQAGSLSVADQLRSDQLAIRARATAALRADSRTNPQALSAHDVQEAVLAAFARENVTIEGNLDTFDRTGVSALSEDYAGYYGELQDLALALLDQPVVPGEFRQRLLGELVRSSYNPRSRFSQRLAREGEALLPLVVDLTRSRIGPNRWNAYALIGYLFKAADEFRPGLELSATARTQLRQAARSGLGDTDAGVRLFAIDAVVAARDVEAIPLLEKMARSDPDSGQGKPSMLQANSVRSRAADAVKALIAIKR